MKVMWIWYFSWMNVILDNGEISVSQHFNLFHSFRSFRLTPPHDKILKELRTECNADEGLKDRRAWEMRSESCIKCDSAERLFRLAKSLLQITETVVRPYVWSNPSTNGLDFLIKLSVYVWAFLSTFLILSSFAPFCFFHMFCHSKSASLLFVTCCLFAIGFDFVALSHFLSVSLCW